jgi:DNA replication licensing factor MCM3
LWDGQTQAGYNYRHATKTMLDNNQNRLIVNLDDLRDYDRTMADGSVSIS